MHRCRKKTETERKVQEEKSVLKNLQIYFSAGDRFIA